MMETWQHLSAKLGYAGEMHLWVREDTWMDALERAKDDHEIWSDPNSVTVHPSETFYTDHFRCRPHSAFIYRYNTRH